MHIAFQTLGFATAHQTWSGFAEWLKGALQSAAFEIAASHESTSPRGSLIASPEENSDEADVR